MPRHTPRSTLFPYTTLFRSPKTRISIDVFPGHLRQFAERPEDGPLRVFFKREELLLKFGVVQVEQTVEEDRKSTRLNSSHMSISYAVFCLKKKKNNNI